MKTRKILLATLVISTVLVGCIGGLWLSFNEKNCECITIGMFTTDENPNPKIF